MSQDYTLPAELEEVPGVSGQLRIADWLTDPSRPMEPPHAFLAVENRIPFRGACGEGHWTVRSQPATRGPLCAACREIVAGAAFRALEHITALEQADLVQVLPAVAS